MWKIQERARLKDSLHLAHLGMAMFANMDFVYFMNKKTRLLR